MAAKNSEMSADAKVWEAFRLALPREESLLLRDYKTATRSNQPREVDIVFATKSFGIVAVEVKTWTIENIVTAGESFWSVKTGKRTHPSPFEQVQEALWGIRRRLEKQLPDLDLQYIPLVALPNIRRSDWLGQGNLRTSIPEKNILFQEELESVHVLLQKLGHASTRTIQLNSAQWSNLKKALSKPIYSADTIAEEDIPSPQPFMRDGNRQQPHHRNRIFISYRRQDTAWAAGRLYAHLNGLSEFRNRVFWDTGTIQPGADWEDEIDQALAESAVVLVIIGERWLTVTDQNNRRRLDNPQDKLVYEIQTALDNGVIVIPILIDDTDMPQTDQLPSVIQKLARKQALQISPDNFDYKANILVTRLRELIQVGRGNA